MSTLKKKLALGLVPLLCCGAVHAAKGNVVGNPEGLYLGAYGFYYMFDNNWEPGHPSAQPEDEFGGGFAMGYQYNQWIGAEVFYERLDTEVDIDGLKDELNPSIDVDHIGAAINFFLQGGVNNPNADGFNPYVSVLGMHQTVDVQGPKNDDIESTLLGLGLGAQWSFTNNLSARLFGRALWNMDEDNFDYQLGAGVFYYFGGVPQPYVEPPVEKDPVFVPETTCDTVRINLDVKFDFDRSVVKSEFYPEIQRVADYMKSNEEANLVLLVGHTDSIGSDRYNQGLSERRANAVRNTLISQFNIDGSRVSVEGRGESQPVADNSTSEGRALNRRVVAEIEDEKCTTK